MKEEEVGRESCGNVLAFCLASESFVSEVEEGRGEGSECEWERGGGGGALTAEAGAAPDGSLLVVTSAAEDDDGL